MTPGYYNGAYRWLAIAFILAVSIGGYFFPVVGLAVPGLMILALVMNARDRRSFCSSACPNGRTLSFVMPRISGGRSLPRFLADKGIRRMLCGFMLFCMINLLVRYGRGGPPAVGRLFWAIYLLAMGISVVAGMLFKPRAWCAFCPMGTLQDTVGPKRTR